MKTFTEEELLQIISEIEVLENKHWKKLDKHGYVDFPETDKEDCWKYTYKDLHLYSHHEQHDFSAIKRFVEWLIKNKQ